MLEEKKKIMGFGHGVYKIQDPRSPVVKNWVEKLISDDEAKVINIENIYMQSLDEQIIFLTASNEDIIKNFNDNNDLNIDFSYTDETVLKTVVRSNPGILRIQEGTVIEKLHHNHFEKLIK